MPEPKTGRCIFCGVPSQAPREEPDQPFSFCDACDRELAGDHHEQQQILLNQLSDIQALEATGARHAI